MDDDDAVAGADAAAALLMYSCCVCLCLDLVDRSRKMTTMVMLRHANITPIPEPGPKTGASETKRDGRHN